jgi:prepilin-type N-terminal cleavage/methylation domain-containing protein
MFKRAFSLIEMLTAISIVVLLAAIVFPVVARARRIAHEAESKTHLRQIGMAISLYKDDYDGEQPFRHPDPFVETRYGIDPRILRSHPDTFDAGYGRFVSDCIDQPRATKLETSYETLLFNKEFYDHVKKADPDAAIVVDRTHGDVLKESDRSCGKVTMYYVGKILRLYEDTHVKTAQFDVKARNAPGGIAAHWSRMRLFTDADGPALSFP